MLLAGHAHQWYFKNLWVWSRNHQQQHLTTTDHHVCCEWMHTDKFIVGFEACRHYLNPLLPPHLGASNTIFRRPFLTFRAPFWVLQTSATTIKLMVGIRNHRSCTKDGIFELGRCLSGLGSTQSSQNGWELIELWFNMRLRIESGCRIVMVLEENGIWRSQLVNNLSWGQKVGC